MTKVQKIFIPVALFAAAIITFPLQTSNSSADEEVVESTTEEETTEYIEMTMPTSQNYLSALYPTVYNMSFPINETTIEETTTEIETTTEETTIYAPETTTIEETTTTVPETTTNSETLKGQYPTAEYVWTYLRNSGYSPAAAAGIIGNMMAECGGWTLNLNPYSWNNIQTSYGLCQWKTCYASPEMANSSIEYQMAYLVSNLPAVLPNSYAGAKASMDIQMFMWLGDPAAAADIFCRGYEQCGNYEIECARRGQFAWQAYDYFLH